MPNLVSESKIFIIGSSITQNVLLAHYLKNSLGYSCEAFLDINQLSSKDIKNLKTLILLDYKDANWKKLVHSFKKETDFTHVNIKCFIALFNFMPVKGSTLELARLGIRGIFNTDHSQDILLKGIKAILNEELWFPRTFLNSIFLKYQSHGHNSEILGTLSVREKQVLDLLSAGYSNDMIADDLCVSIHTIKTHIYNIYRKINVKNRLQATQWLNNKYRLL